MCCISGDLLTMDTPYTEKVRERANQQDSPRPRHTRRQWLAQSQRPTAGLRYRLHQKSRRQSTQEIRLRTVRAGYASKASDIIPGTTDKGRSSVLALLSEKSSRSRSARAPFWLNRSKGRITWGQRRRFHPGRHWQGVLHQCRGQTALLRRWNSKESWIECFFNNGTGSSKSTHSSYWYSSRIIHLINALWKPIA